MRPPGYPAELEAELVLADGRGVFIRPVTPDDAPALRAAIASADSETLRRRFLGGRAPRTTAELTRLTTLDYDRRLALAAFDPAGHGVGIARYEGEAGNDAAEIAVVIDPAWRHVGLATALVTALAGAAERRGIRRFTASYYADNLDVRDILRASHLTGQERHEGGIVETSVDLPGDQ